MFDNRVNQCAWHEQLKAEKDNVLQINILCYFNCCKSCYLQVHFFFWVAEASTWVLPICIIEIC